MLIFLFKQAIDLVRFRLQVVTHFLWAVSCQYGFPILCMLLEFLPCVCHPVSTLGPERGLYVNSLLKVLGMLIGIRSMHAQLGGKPIISSWGHFPKLLPLYDLPIFSVPGAFLFSSQKSRVLLTQFCHSLLHVCPCQGPRSRKIEKKQWRFTPFFWNHSSTSHRGCFSSL